MAARTLLAYDETVSIEDFPICVGQPLITIQPWLRFRERLCKAQPQLKTETLKLRGLCCDIIETNVGIEVLDHKSLPGEGKVEKSTQTNQLTAGGMVACVKGSTARPDASMQIVGYASKEHLG